MPAAHCLVSQQRVRDSIPIRPHSSNHRLTHARTLFSRNSILWASTFSFHAGSTITGAPAAGTWGRHAGAELIAQFFQDTHLPRVRLRPHHSSMGLAGDQSQSPRGRPRAPNTPLTLPVSSPMHEMSPSVKYGQRIQTRLPMT